MTVEKAKEFLVELADDEETSARIDQAYFDALRAASADLGYDVSDDDLATAVVEMSGLLDEDVSGFRFSDSVFGLMDSIVGFEGRRPGLFGNPLGFQPKRLGG